ncbi:hypothetical protein FRB99_003537 [Tulasnella sp. 403]|nr:hypothetical protein FRB99_003537 [Tulasnella sp. 403]
MLGQSPEKALRQLFWGRAIGGFGVGMISTAVPTYISESSPKHLRGRLTGMYQLFNVTGIALSFWANYFLLLSFGEDPTKSVQWRIAFALQILPGALLVFAMLAQPESPRWLAERGRYDETRAALAWLRGLSPDHPDVAEELYAIKTDLQGRSNFPLSQQVKEVISSGKVLYRCSLPVILMAFQQWTGVNAINYYSPIIFRQLGMGQGSASLFGTGIYGVVKIVATLLVLALGVEQYGRKALLVWGGLGQASCMFFIGLYRRTHPDDTATISSYFAILAIYLYVTFFSFGWSVAPWPAMSESVPNHVRSLTMSTGLMSNWFFNAVISKITPLLLNSITYGTYFLFGGSTILGVI